MSSHVFKIQAGVLAFTLVDTAAVGYLPEWQTPGGIAIDTITVAAYTADGNEFSCQVTSGALTASPNTTDDSTPATFCDPEQTETTVGVTSFTLDATILQDPDFPDGASAFAMENDTKECFFILGLDGVNPPKTVGRCRMVAGAFGGDARVTLTADLSLPVSRKPDTMYGNVTTSRIVWGSGDPPAGWTPPAPLAAATAAPAGAKTTTNTSDAVTTE